jgi:serine/threonine protein kinase
VTPSGAITPSASARVTPGAIIAGRYRLLALLGRGGMGEVYRADDLTLDQPVALKFLPESAARDQAHLAQFHNELRTARQVSHKNVCRLYDLGEAGGRRFLTMEYVDGEDPSAFTPAQPEWAPNGFADTRAAWEGQYRSPSRGRSATTRVTT